MKKIELAAEVRTDLGKKAGSQVRKAGRVPGVLYGGKDILHFSVEPLSLRPFIYTPDFSVVLLKLDGETYECILKDVQFHPVTDNITHIDLLRLTPGQDVKVELPVKFKGVSPGVKLGGKLSQKIRRVKVKTVPEKLVNQLFVDISTMELGQSIRIRDIEVVEGIEIMNPPAIPVATVEIPRALRSAAAAEKKAE